MAKDDIPSNDDAPADEDSQLKRRARRRLIGAAALALFAAIVLPLVMDHQPPVPLKDIQVRIPAPDETGTQRVVVRPAKPEAPVAPAVVAPPPVSPEKTLVKPESGQDMKPEARPEPKQDPRPEPRSDMRPEPKPEPRIETKPEPRQEARPEQKPEQRPAHTAEAWEVQLGAYQEPGRVKLLLGKLKELGVPTYTEKVDTPSGSRTRVRAGPFASQEEAEKARVRVKIVGVDGPVAKKP